MAYDGAAESTSPKPAIMRMAQWGWPMAAQTWPSMPGPREAAADWLMCWLNMRRNRGRSEMA